MLHRPRLARGGSGRHLGAGDGRGRHCDRGDVEISPDTARRLAAAAAKTGVDYLDCPVSGGPLGAEAGSLAIWVGGGAEAMERARPVLEVIGYPAKLLHCGEVGAGLVVKLANNYLARWGRRLGRGAGHGPGRGRRSRPGGGSGRRGYRRQLAAGQPHAPQGAGRRYPTAGFKIAHMAKDLRIATEVAAALGVEAPVLDLARSRFEQARDRYGDDVDYSAVARLAGW